LTQTAQRHGLLWGPCKFGLDSNIPPLCSHSTHFFEAPQKCWPQEAGQFGIAVGGMRAQNTAIDSAQCGRTAPGTARAGAFPESRASTNNDSCSSKGLTGDSPEWLSTPAVCLCSRISAALACEQIHYHETNHRRPQPLTTV